MPTPKSISLTARLRRVKLFPAAADGVLPPCPGGMTENSPAFQRREQADAGRVPKGRLNGGRSAQLFNRPSGTRHRFPASPALKRRASVKCPSGTQVGVLVPKGQHMNSRGRQPTVSRQNQIRPRRGRTLRQHQTVGCTHGYSCLAASRLEMPRVQTNSRTLPIALRWMLVVGCSMLDVFHFPCHAHA
jgi:hypothetical protein